MLKGLINSVENPSFMAKHKRKLQAESSDSEYYNSRSESEGQLNKFNFTEYSPTHFRIIQHISQITKQILYNSLNPEFNKKCLMQVEEGEGKSGSFFFLSHDQQFIIKIIQKGEKNNILNMLGNYVGHLKKNPDSLLTRIYSLFKVKINGMATVYAILVPHAFYNQGDVKVLIVYI